MCSKRHFIRVLSQFSIKKIKIMRQNDSKNQKNGLLKGYFFGILCLLSACNPSKPNLITDPFADKQAVIAQTVQDIFKSGKAKDFAVLEAFHLNSPKFTKFDDGEPMTRQDYAQNQKGEKDGFSALESFDYTIVDLKVDVFDKVAVATFIMDYAIQVQGTKMAAKSRATLVFVEDAGKWKITHEHFSSFKPSL
jgi:ketosteroid isomerase-like protein